MQEMWTRVKSGLQWKGLTWCESSHKMSWSPAGVWTPHSYTFGNRLADELHVHLALSCHNTHAYHISSSSENMGKMDRQNLLNRPRVYLGSHANQTSVCLASWNCEGAWLSSNTINFLLNRKKYYKVGNTEKPWGQRYPNMWCFLAQFRLDSLYEVERKDPPMGLLRHRGSHKIW